MLIVCALAIQVVVGFLAMFVTHTRNYHKRFRDAKMSEFISLWRRCFFREPKESCSNSVDKPDKGVSIPKVETPTVTKNGICVNANDIAAVLHKQLVQAKLAAIEAEAERDSLNLQLEMETKRRRDVAITLEAAVKEAVSSDVTGHLEKTKQEQSESGKSLAELEKGIAGCDATINQVDVLRRQDQLMVEYHENKLEQYVLKKVSFWQNIINYLLYTVFVCNVFITGLGVTGHHGGTSGGPGGN